MLQTGLKTKMKSDEHFENDVGQCVGNRWNMKSILEFDLKHVSDYIFENEQLLETLKTRLVERILKNENNVETFV